MNYREEITKIVNVLKDVIPPLEATIVRQQASHENIKSISKELKKINYRLDRIRSDLKLGGDKVKETKEIANVSNSSRIDNGCAESN